MSGKALRRTLMFMGKISFIGIIVSSALATSLEKSNFKNSNGYQLAIPACVSLKTGDAFDEGPLSESKNVALEMGAACHLGNRASGGISIEVEDAAKDKDSFKKEFDKRLAWAKKGDDHAAGEVVKIGTYDSIRYVDLMPGETRSAGSQRYIAHRFE